MQQERGGRDEGARRSRAGAECRQNGMNNWSRPGMECSHMRTRMMSFHRRRKPGEGRGVCTEGCVQPGAGV